MFVLIDFALISLSFMSVRCRLKASFLVRNWCGSLAIETWISGVCRDRSLVGFDFLVTGDLKVEQLLRA